MWSFDQTVTIEKPLVTFPWRSIGFYALTGQSVITFKEELVKETIVEALEEIHKQNPAEWSAKVLNTYQHLLYISNSRVTTVSIPKGSPATLITLLTRKLRSKSSWIEPSACWVLGTLHQADFSTNQLCEVLTLRLLTCSSDETKRTGAYARLGVTGCGSGSFGLHGRCESCSQARTTRPGCRP